MAEAAEKPESTISPSYFDLADPDIRTVYANRATAMIGDSDISLYFGIDTQSPGSETGKLSTRVVMSHAKFLLLVEFLATRYDVINTMYRGAPPSIDYVTSVDPEHAKQAWEKLRGPQQKQSEEGSLEDGVSPPNKDESSR